ncbi:MAG: hypothetical protein QM666_03625 [Acinetobacter sp.]
MTSTTFQDMPSIQHCYTTALYTHHIRLSQLHPLLMRSKYRPKALYEVLIEVFLAN